VISASEYFFPPEWSLIEQEDGFLTEYLAEGYLFDDGQTRSQNTEKVYCSNGAVSIAEVQAWRETGMFYTERTLPYEMPRLRSFDLDEPEDLMVVRALLDSEQLD
jgi:CMP-N-acetylneuraminic acid synthetase